MSKFRKKFSDKKWKKCCGSMCKDCDIYLAYREEYGKKEGEKKFRKDHGKMSVNKKL